MDRNRGVHSVLITADIVLPYVAGFAMMFTHVMGALSMVDYKVQSCGCICRERKLCTCGQRRRFLPLTSFDKATI